MPTPAEDRKYIETALPELQTYLLSDTLFYPLTYPLPRLTLGGLLLAQRRLHAYEDASSLDLRLDTLRSKWCVAWEKKAIQEFETRLTLWRNYLDDCREEEALLENYAREVRWRVMLGLLSAELPADSSELNALDQRLRTKFRMGEFIWDEALVSEFSQDDYWFLYGKMK